jgi:hypothetical protein
MLGLTQVSYLGRSCHPQAATSARSTRKKRLSYGHKAAGKLSSLHKTSLFTYAHTCLVSHKCLTLGVRVILRPPPQHGRPGRRGSATGTRPLVSYHLYTRPLFLHMRTHAWSHTSVLPWAFVSSSGRHLSTVDPEEEPQLRAEGRW